MRRLRDGAAAGGLACRLPFIPLLLVLLPLPAAAAGGAAVDGATGAASGDVRGLVRAAVQPVLDEMARKHNTSFSFGLATESGTLALAGGVDDVWTGKLLTPQTLVPLGSVTKPWTAVRVLQAVEAGRISLDDLASSWVDPVLARLGHLSWIQKRTNRTLSLVGLWGPQAARVRIRDLLAMTSGFADYDDERIMNWTFEHAGEDMGPFAYVVSAAQERMVCRPGSCTTYSGANYVLLGFALLQLEGTWAWQDFDQLSVIPRSLWERGNYRHTSFAKLGRCSQYEGYGHQYASYATYPEGRGKPHLTFQDLLFTSCLNGWTMGNIATTGEDLATFFYDLFHGSLLNATSLAAMTDWHQLPDDWCEGPRGYGSCQYGMGLLRDQVGQDVFPLRDPRADKEAVRVDGHPGEDWGSQCAPCGYNARYKFGLCVAGTSLIGMNCSNPLRTNYRAYEEASCKLYDAVLGVFGGPRLRCPDLRVRGPLRLPCLWTHQAPFPLSVDAGAADGWRRGRRRLRGRDLAAAASVVV